MLPANEHKTKSRLKKSVLTISLIKIRNEALKSLSNTHSSDFDSKPFEMGKLARMKEEERRFFFFFKRWTQQIFGIMNNAVCFVWHQLLLWYHAGEATFKYFH